MKIALSIAIVCSLIFLKYVVAWPQEIIWEELRTEGSRINTVAVNTINPRLMYAGTDRAVISSIDAGAAWERSLSVKGGDRAVYCVVFDQMSPVGAYAATGGGLYYRDETDSRWQRIFRGKNSLENCCTAVAARGNSIYLGTKAGLFTSHDKGKSWQRGALRLRSGAILSIAYSSHDPRYCYVAGVDGLFLINESTGIWEKAYVQSPSEIETEPDEDQEEEEVENKESSIRQVAPDEKDPQILYLATSRGLLKSPDRGKSWDRISNYGLLTSDVHSVVSMKGRRLCAATKSAVFAYEGQRWKELPLPAAGDVLCLRDDGRNTLYIGSSKGLYKVVFREGAGEGAQAMPVDYQRNEPDIKNVQQAATKYAEVNPEKIYEWRSQAKKKAWLPKVNLGFNRNTTDLWHWESGSTTREGDDALIRGNDSLDWDLSLSWDLGELVWNNDQTSIDVRSRLMVQLRQDVLDEVTKLYFERIRVKHELESLRLEERKKRFDKELKLQELDASLDSLTGGYFLREAHSEK